MRCEFVDPSLSSMESQLQLTRNMVVTLGASGLKSPGRSILVASWFCSSVYSDDVGSGLTCSALTMGSHPLRNSMKVWIGCEVNKAG